MIEYLYLFLISMLPVAELRGAIPLGIYWGLFPPLVFLISILGNMVPVPFILIFLESVEKLLRKSEMLSRALDWVFERTYRKASSSVRRWEYLALIFFVAVPLPGTGAWTGSLIAYLFKFDIKKSFLAIFAGVLVAGLLVTLASLGVFKAL